MAWASARIVEKTPNPSVIPTEERSDEWRDLLFVGVAPIVEKRPLGVVYPELRRRARGDGF
jgi:hypothetical protein